MLFQKDGPEADKKTNQIVNIKANIQKTQLKVLLFQNDAGILQKKHSVLGEGMTNDRACHLQVLELLALKSTCTMIVHAVD